MMVRRLVYTMGALLLMINVVKSQCLDDLKAYIANNINAESTKKGQVYFVSLSMQNILWKDNTDQNIDIKIYREGEKLIYEAGEVSIYKDQSDAFMIIHPLKRIVWQKTDYEFNDNKVKELAEMQLKIIENSTLLRCSKSPENQNLLEISLKPNDHIRSTFNADHLKIHFDSERRLISQIEIDFTEDSKLKKQFIRYKELDYNYRKKRLPTAKDMVFNQEGALLASLSGYNLIKN